MLHGRIVHGDERGKQLGFPTANLTFSRGQALPEDGVAILNFDDPWVRKMEEKSKATT